MIAETYDFDWQTAEKEFRLAIQLDPDYSTAHQWYAEYLAWPGRFDEALAKSERARQLDPLSLIIATDHGPNSVLLAEIRSRYRTVPGCARYGSDFCSCPDIRDLWVSIVELKLDPNYDPLRNDPRFQDLLRRVGLAN